MSDIAKWAKFELIKGIRKPKRVGPKTLKKLFLYIDIMVMKGTYIHPERQAQPLLTKMMSKLYGKQIKRVQSKMTEDEINERILYNK